jgi:hypothetical protein
VNEHSTLEAFLAAVTDAYVLVTYDIGPIFRNADFRRVLERLGSEAWAVPADAHWHSAVEKSVELVRVEFDAALHEFQELSGKAALQLALMRANSRSLWAHDVTRPTVHFGRPANRPKLREHVFA